MHKSLRQRVQKASRIERKIQALSFSETSESRKEMKRMAENRHWYDRKPKGALLSASDKASGKCIIII